MSLELVVWFGTALCQAMVLPSLFFTLHPPWSSVATSYHQLVIHYSCTEFLISLVSAKLPVLIKSNYVVILSVCTEIPAHFFTNLDNLIPLAYEVAWASLCSSYNMSMWQSPCFAIYGLFGIYSLFHHWVYLATWETFKWLWRKSKLPFTECLLCTRHC